MGPEPGSGHGRAARVVTAGGENAQQGAFEVVGSLDDGHESGGKTVFQRTGLPQLCGGLGGGKMFAFEDVAEAQRQFRAEFRILDGGFLHPVDRAVQIRARKQFHQKARVDLHVSNTTGMVLADPGGPANLFGKTGCGLVTGDDGRQAGGGGQLVVIGSGLKIKILRWFVV